MPRKDDIQGLLTERFQQFEAEPEVDLWKGIEAELYPEKSKKRVLWTYFSVAASVLILISTWIYLSQSTQADLNGDSPIVEQQIPEEKNESSNSTSPANKLFTEEKQETIAEEGEKMENPLASQSAKTKVSSSEKDNENKLQLFEVKSQKTLQDAQEKETQPESTTEQKLLAMEVIPMQKASGSISTPAIQEPEVGNVIIKTSEKPQPAESKSMENKKEIDLNNLSFKSIVSLASDRLDKIKNASPVKVYEEKNEKGESRVYELNLFKFSVSHKTQKRRNKKVRL